MLLLFSSEITQIFVFPVLFLDYLLESFLKSFLSLIPVMQVQLFSSPPQFAVCIYEGHSIQIIENRNSAYLKAQEQILPPAMCAPGEQGKGVTMLTRV